MRLAALPSATVNVRWAAAFVLVVLASTLVGVGCGGDDDPTTEAAPTSVETEQAAPTDLDRKPTVEAPDGQPPSSLETEDLVEGDGEPVRSGDELEVQYVGVSYASGEEFDASWDRGEPFVFELGAEMVIPGWDEGLEGMKVGGRRKLTIPPDLAYGQQGSPPAIGPDETLVFVIDLLDAR